MDGVEKPSTMPLPTTLAPFSNFFTQFFGSSQDNLAAVAAPSDGDDMRTNIDPSRFINVETFSPDGKVESNEIFQSTGEGDSIQWSAIVSESENEIATSTSAFATTTAATATTTNAFATSTATSTPVTNAISCPNPTHLIVVGGIGSPPDHPIFSFIEEIAPGATQIFLKGKSVDKATQEIRNAIQKELDGNRSVLVVAHSLGAILSFNIKDEFKGKPVEFMYLDPPYKQTWTNIPGSRFFSNIFSEVATAINKAYKAGIANDSNKPNIVNWTDGRGSGKDHDPWSYPVSGTNAQKLEDLKKRIQTQRCAPVIDPSSTDSPEEAVSDSTGEESGGLWDKIVSGVSDAFTAVTNVLTGKTPVRKSAAPAAAPAPTATQPHPVQNDVETGDTSGTDSGSAPPIPCAAPSADTQPAETTKRPSSGLSFGSNRLSFRYEGGTSSSIIDASSLLSLHADGTLLTWAGDDDAFVCRLNGVYVQANGSRSLTPSATSCTYTLICTNTEKGTRGVKTVTASGR